MAKIVSVLALGVLGLINFFWMMIKGWGLTPESWEVLIVGFCLSLLIAGLLEAVKKS